MSNTNSGPDFFYKNIKQIPTLIKDFKQAMEDINSPVNSEIYFYL